MRVRKLAILCVAGGLVAPAAFSQQASAPKKAALNFNQAVSYIGVNIQEIDSDRAKALKLREEAGVEVTRVEPDSPGEKAGVKTGDVITQYNGQRVEGIEMFSRLVRETPVGREAKLSLIRNGAEQTITVKVGSRQTDLISDLKLLAPGANIQRISPNLKIQIPDIPRSRMSWRSSMLGIEVESLEGQLGEYFGVKSGVLVRSVVKASAAEKAGIKAGDVIIRVDNSGVNSPSELSSHLRSATAKSVSLTLMREHKEMNISVALDDRASTRSQDDGDRF